MGRPAKTTDSDVLDITYALAWQRGCDDITIRDLEVALDIRAPSIYRRFHSRDELLAAAVDRYSDRVVGGRVRRYLENDSNPLEGIRGFFLSAVDSEFLLGAVDSEVLLGAVDSEVHLGAVDSEVHLGAVDSTTPARMPRGCLLATTSQQSSYAVPAIRDAVDRGVAKVEEALRAALDRAAAQGHQFTSPRHDLAWALLQNFLGVLMLARCGHDHLEPSVTIMLDALLGPIKQQGAQLL